MDYYNFKVFNSRSFITSVSIPWASEACHVTFLNVLDIGFTLCDDVLSTY